MIQYLKNMAGYSHAQLKDKSFDEVQKLFEKHMKWINIIVPMEEDLPSKQYKRKLRSNEKEEKVSKQNEINCQLLSEFDREDLVNLWKLVKAKHGDNRPEEDFERVLWGDLRVMFEPDIESTDKSKIARKQSKTSKHGHENLKSTKRSQRIKAEARKVKSNAPEWEGHVFEPPLEEDARSNVTVNGATLDPITHHQEQLEIARTDWKNVMEKLEITKRARDEARSIRTPMMEKHGSYKDFISVNPPEFYGEADPIKSTNWVKAIEVVHEIIRCAEGQKVTYAAKMLRGTSAFWWEALSQYIGEENVKNMTWGFFKAYFLEEYCPQSLLDVFEE
ncbi:hypothetical protein Tco_0586469 [Tanacetum coccineum]